MKRLVSLLFLFLIAISGCKKNIPVKWVISLPGAGLLAEASTTSPRIAVIPLGEQVEVKNETGPEVIVDGNRGNLQQIMWKDKKGWAFSGHLASEYPFRWTTPKSGLPFHLLEHSNFSERLIPYKTKVIYLGPSKYGRWVTILWNGRKVLVLKEFLSPTPDIEFNYPELREHATKKLANHDNMQLYPEDLYIEKNAWLYHIIYIYYEQLDERGYNESLWTFKNDKWEQLDADGQELSYIAFKILDINDDMEPDVIGHGGCCVSYQIQVYLGSPDKSLKKIFDESGSDKTADDYESNPSPTLLSEGGCGKTIIEYRKQKYTFDCTKNEFIVK